MTTSPQFAPATVTCGIERVSPTDAAEMLSHNTRNREVSPATVNAYLRAMTQGNWHFTGETIVFDDEGVLNNGQHTLTAISKMPVDYRIDLLVVRGVTAVSQQFSDQGRKRTLAHLMTINGTTRNATSVSSVGKRIYEWETGLFFMDNTNKGKNREVGNSNVEVHVWLEERPQIEEWVSGHMTLLRRQDKPVSAVGAALYIIESGCPTKGKEFVDAFLSQNRTASDGVLKALDQELRSLALRYDRDIMGVIFLAWNFWSQKKNRVSLGVPKAIVPEGASKALPRWTVATFPRPFQEI